MRRVTRVLGHSNQAQSRKEKWIHMLNHISHISIQDVQNHYRSREAIHKDLLGLMQAQRKDAYVKLALGITNSLGNYSADEHKLGPRILVQNTNATNRVFNLGQALLSCLSVQDIPSTVYNAQMSQLKISVGSEMALMLRPDDFWVGNVRTIWAYLLIKHNWDYNIANEELELYRDDDISSEMAYQKWKAIYLSMRTNLDILVNLGNQYAVQERIKPGNLKYLWVDAIANALYEYDEGE
jgi:hypothetical protein